MDNTNVAPINHSAGSAFATSAYEASKGAMKGTWKSLFFSAKLGAVALGGICAIMTAISGIGAVATLVGAGGATASVIAGAVSSAILGTIGSAIGMGLLGGAIGGLLMFVPFVGAGVIAFGLGSGLLKGVNHGVERVSQERGAATQLSAQVEAYKTQMQAVAPTIDNKFNFPAQGSLMNQASTSISAVQPEGRVSSNQLQVA